MNPLSENLLRTPFWDIFMVKPALTCVDVRGPLHVPWVGTGRGAGDI